MTITMTGKHQITIPKKITELLGLERGTMFKIRTLRNRIELIPLEIREREFNEDIYKKLDILSLKEKKKERLATKSFIKNLKMGRS